MRLRGIHVNTSKPVELGSATRDTHDYGFAGFESPAHIDGYRPL
jgi:hypothetical protein